MDAAEARRLLKSLNESKKWAYRVSKMSDAAVYVMLKRLEQQTDLRNVA